MAFDSRARTLIFVAIIAASAATPAHAQLTGTFLAPPDQVIAIRAGRLFDSRNGTLLNNQIVLVKGDRITDTGPLTSRTSSTVPSRIICP